MFWMFDEADYEYGWVITKDKIGGKAGVVGPRNVSDEIVEKLKSPIKNGAQKFRMLDDDKNIYYYGYLWGDGDETMFEPLDDYGMPNAGAVHIQYKNKEGDWEYL